MQGDNDPVDVVEIGSQTGVMGAVYKAGLTSFSMRSAANLGLLQLQTKSCMTASKPCVCWYVCSASVLKQNVLQKQMQQTRTAPSAR